MATTHPTLMLSLAAIVASKSNPRKTFDDAFMKELTASILQHGVLQPILVRPIGKKNGHTHELVAGEQRFRAAREAGLKEIPAVVRTLTDNEARELQIVENLQRKDVHPMEEGAGYKGLLDLKDDKGQPVYDVHALAAKVNKSVSYIWQRLKLASLLPAGQDLFFRGVINTEHAILIARLGDEQQKRTLLETVRRIEGSTPAEFQVHSVRQLRQYIQEKVYRSLDKAGFPLDDKTLNPSMGACIGCKYNTAATPGLYPDVAGNCCSYEPCFEVKIAAMLTRKQRELAKETGGEVLAVTRDRSYEVDPKKRERLAGVLTADKFQETKHNAAGAKKALVVDGRGRGEVIYIAPVRDTAAPATKTPAEKTRRLEERASELEGRIESETARTLIARMARKAKAGDREYQLDVLAWGIERSYQTDEIVKLLDRVQPTAAWIPKPKGGEDAGRVFKESVKAYRDRLAKMKPEQLAAVAAVVACVNARWHEYSMNPGENKLKALTDAAARVRVDVKAVGREVRDSFKPAFAKLKDAKKKVHDKPAKKKATPLKLEPGQVVIAVVGADGFKTKVGAWKVGEYFGVHAAVDATGFKVTHLPTGYSTAPYAKDDGYAKKETATYVAGRLTTVGGKAWDFMFVGDAAKLAEAIKAEVKRLSDDRVAAKEAKDAPAKIATPAAQAAAVAATAAKGAPVGKPALVAGTPASKPNGKGNGHAVPAKAQASAARKTAPPVKRATVQTSARRR